MRFVLVPAAILLSLSVAAAPAPAAFGPDSGFSEKTGKGKKKPRKCKQAQIPVKFGKKSRCLPASKALPAPKAGDPRREVIVEALTPDIAKIPDPKDKLPPPMERVYRKLGPQAQKGMEQMVGQALNRLDAMAAGRPAPGAGAAAARAGVSASEANSFSHQFGNVTIDARLSIALVGAELVGTVDFGTTTDRGDGTTLKVSTQVPIRLQGQGFRSSACPTLEGKVDAKDGIGITVRTEVRSNQGKTLEEFYETEVVDDTELQGIVADDAKLDTLEIRSIQEIKESVGGSAFGGSMVRGSVVRNTVVDMRTGQYQPHVSLVNVGVKLSGILGVFAPFIQGQVAQRLKAAADKDFATTVDHLIKKYRELEAGWNTPNRCTKLKFGKANESQTLKMGDKGSETVEVDANAGGTPPRADWSVTGQENGAFTIESHGANPTSFKWQVTQGGENLRLRGRLRAVSKVGVAEDSWVQKIDQDTINRIVGTYSIRQETFGSVFEYAGNAEFIRAVPAFLGPVDGTFELVNGLYTFTASGKASILVTDQCSMKGSGQFAMQKGSQFTVFSRLFDGQPPYDYSYSFGTEMSGGLPPTIEIETYACGKGAEELEGKRAPYPSTIGFSTPEPRESPDGVDYSGTITTSVSNFTQTETWDFEGR